MDESSLLLLGATGFIGSRLAQTFADNGYRVTGIARDPAPGDWCGDARFLQSDLGETGRYGDALDSAHTVFYAAGETVPGDTGAGPGHEMDVGLNPFVRLLDALAKRSGRHLVFVSSGGAIYGRADSTPVTEHLRSAPISYYAAGKAAMEAFLQVFAAQTANRVTILRPSNLYGPGQPKRPGFGLVRTVIDCLAEDRPLTIWGDGSIARDYLHIDDFTAACSKVVNTGENSALRIFNVACGEAYSINEVCDIAERVSGRALQRAYQSPRQTDPERICLDISRIREECGWTPGITLEDGIRGVWQARVAGIADPE